MNTLVFLFIVGFLLIFCCTGLLYLRESEWMPEWVTNLAAITMFGGAILVVIALIGVFKLIIQALT